MRILTVKTLNGNSFRNDYICRLKNSIIFKTISVVLGYNILLVAVEKLKKTNFTYLVYCNTSKSLKDLTTLPDISVQLAFLRPSNPCGHIGLISHKLTHHEKEKTFGI